MEERNIRSSRISGNTLRLKFLFESIGYISNRILNDENAV